MDIQQQPGVSVIARLMGIDAIPMTMTMPAVNKQETSSSNLLKNEARPLIHQPKCSLACSYSRHWRWCCLRRKTTATRLNNAKVGVGGRSGHPQEHLLQKMEEDFLSWQASQAATTWGKGNNSSSRSIQIIAQDNLRREKMATRYTQCTLQLQMTHSEADKSDEDGDGKGSTCTSEIVLLKPLSVPAIPPADDAGEGQLLLFGFGLSRVKRDHSMEQLIQQVKDRLQNQLKLKCAGDVPTDPLGRRRLSRSEAFRAHSTTDSNCAIIATTSAKHASPDQVVKMHVHNHEFEAPDANQLSIRTDDKAFLRRVLIAAGLYYDGSLEEKANNALDDTMLASHIFDEVKEDSTDRRMLFDLANEALQILVLGAQSRYSSSLCRCQWVIDSTGVSRGSKLLDHVWQQVQALRCPQMLETQTIEVACQVRKSVWDAHQDVYLLGGKLERAIFDELIQDLLLEISISESQ